MSKRNIVILILFSIIVGVSLFMLRGFFTKKGQSSTNELISMTLSLTSPAFDHNGAIPSKYTCEGEDINPPLFISDVLEHTKSLVLIVDDPDAPRGTWDHWIMWNIHPETRQIEENKVPDGAVEGMNDFGKHEYGGPCPPSGTHRYYFKLYALDTTLDLTPASKKQDVEQAMAGHIIEETVLIGLYQRR